MFTAMPELEIKRSLDADDVAVVTRMLERAARADGRFPLSDHLWIDLESGGGPGFVALIAHCAQLPIGYAQVSRGNGTVAAEVVIDPDHRDATRTLERALLSAAIEVARAEGTAPVDWWVFDATPADDEMAQALGLSPTRHLHQMRRPLPTGIPIDVETRSFRPGSDEAAWLEVNNRAFAGHPEQGGWTMEMLRQREAEPWFDPDGFRLHERDGRLAAFCWTKLHADAGGTDIGEIYVIAVDPDFRGLGLGRQLTLAGLDSMDARGVHVGMLYVDADNAAGVALYERLGFAIHRTDRAYRSSR
jgi:mycothiol synthase